MGFSPASQSRLLVLIAEWSLCVAHQPNQLQASNDIMASHSCGFEQQHTFQALEGLERQLRSGMCAACKPAGSHGLGSHHVFQG